VRVLGDDREVRQVPKGRYTAVYMLWIAICAILFILLSKAEDPSRRSGRILNNDAGEIALRLIHERGAEYRGYEVVHVAYASGGEAGPDARWIVLLDAAPHTALKKAVVVELRATDGALLRMRRPE
jgi:hypothetical protein